MATYTGDATITRADRISGSVGASDASGTYVLYTVPAGHFAEVQIFSASGSTQNADVATVAVGPFILINVSGNGGLGSVSYQSDLKLIDEGETIRLTIVQSGVPDANAAINVMIKEYNKP